MSGGILSSPTPEAAEAEAKMRLPFLEEAAKPRFLIWSFRHKAWWRHEGKGYTRNRVSAGRFTYEEAMAQALDPVSLDKDAPAGDALIKEYR